MAASDFNYADYLLFAAAKDVNHALYATVAGGVLGLLKNSYGIYVEAETLTYNKFVESTVFDFNVAPVQSVTSITYDSTLYVDGTDFSWYGRDVVLTSAIADTRIPLNIVLEMGYALVPADLKLAIYRHIDATIFALENDTDSIGKVTNSTGNTVAYRDDIIPSAVRATYEFYSERIQVLS